VQQIDLRSSFTPLTYLLITRAFRSLEVGGYLEILSGDTKFAQEIDHLLRRFPHTVEVIGHEADCSVIRIRKEGASVCLCERADNPPAQPQPMKEVTMSEVDLNTVEASSTVDARGSACPGPLLEAKKGIGKVKVGEVLEVYSNDSGTRNDIPAWANKVGHEYLGVLAADGYDKHFVRRAK
jgi:TusA-related sulfurtransferase